MIERDTLLRLLSDSIRAVTERLAGAFASERHELYFIGGSVRGLLLGQPVADLDFATDAEPAAT